MGDYIPSPDSDFDAWSRNFVDNVVANAAAMGVSPAQVTTLQGQQTDWGVRYPASTSKQAEANSAVQAKNDTRGGYGTSFVHSSALSSQAPR
jgi:hypothetical protein